MYKMLTILAIFFHEKTSYLLIYFSVLFSQPLAVYFFTFIVFRLFYFIFRFHAFRSSLFSRFFFDLLTLGTKKCVCKFRRLFVTYPNFRNRHLRTFPIIFWGGLMSHCTFLCLPIFPIRL